MALGLLLALASSQAQDLALVGPPRLSLEWQTDTLLREGLRWRSIQTQKLFASRQSLNVLEVDLSVAALQLGFAYLEAGRIPTAQLADSLGAVAAINGTFFNMQRGGSVCFLQIEDSVIAPSSSPTTFVDEGALAVKSDGGVHILPKPDSGWIHLHEYPHAMSSGPLLIFGGRILPAQNTKFSLNRHPRTAVGLTEQGKLLLLTVDGRHARAQGLSIPELAKLMHALGCVHALNLDGGGSTTMWLNGFPHQGVVNYPSDNKQFDHEGARAVANIVALLPRENGQ